jgi:hypothetical protein
MRSVESVKYGLMPILTMPWRTGRPLPDANESATAQSQQPVPRGESEAEIAGTMIEQPVLAKKAS